MVKEDRAERHVSRGEIYRAGRPLTDQVQHFLACSYSIHIVVIGSTSSSYKLSVLARLI